ncbi:diguanylate cyclase [Rhizobium sp. TRM95796]|uniref:GGDEF domain-containing response regulator n=1 Tax=Rhizobium sp. TRM95796 TaxID=2979862 RepID=UPI0021E74D6D|nr:diguanylate cyclase [Rhizobium sp. TRM95796]MCV3765671.1 diguanylate cyclase [Rhizobium sp. TRM95796]
MPAEINLAYPRMVDARAAVLLVEGSESLSLLLKTRIEAEADVDVVACHTLAEARAALRARRFTLVVAARTLPDGPDGEIVAAAEKAETPFILLTATFDPSLRSRFARQHLVDYFVKDNAHAAQLVTAAVVKFIANRDVTVLVVDDSASGRSRLTDILRRQNFTVTQTSCAEDAMRRIDAGGVELVIVDYYMPGMNGYELIRKIRETHPSDRIRLIGVSASSDRMLAAAFLKAGASDFLYRPFVTEELQCRLDAHVETLNQIKRLRHLAEHDPLTGLHNRRAFFEHARRRLRDLEDRGRRGSVFIVDIDHFKQINDTHGHEAGDRVLIGAAKLIKAHADLTGALSARFGGEEFVVLSTDLTDIAAEASAEALRTHFAASRFDAADEPISATISIGLAELDPGETLSNALNAADQMLYLAKSGGRNRVVSDRSFA